jgi:hypothetical protein
MTPQTCKDFQKEEMISIKAIFFSINPEVISRKAGCFDKGRNFEKGAVFRENRYFFEILGEYSKKIRFIQQKEFLSKKDLYAKSLVVFRYLQDHPVTRVNTTEGSLLKRRIFKSSDHI